MDMMQQKQTKKVKKIWMCRIFRNKFVQCVLVIILAYFLVHMITHRKEVLLELQINICTIKDKHKNFELDYVKFHEQAKCIEIGYESSDFYKDDFGEAVETLYRSLWKFFFDDNKETYKDYRISLGFSRHGNSFTIDNMNENLTGIQIRESWGLATDEIMELFPEITHLSIQSLKYDSLESIGKCKELKTFRCSAKITSEEKAYLSKCYPNCALDVKVK